MRRRSWALSMLLWSCANEEGDSRAERATLDGGTTSQAADATAEPATEDARPASAEACDVPAEEAALLRYLRDGHYRSFERESEPYVSAGPHPGLVQTYLSPVLVRSLMEGRALHPPCSAAIKELLSARGELQGWAVFLKTAEASPDGRHVIWLETTSTSASAPPDFYGRGLRLCAGCHERGRDFVRVLYPLR